MGFLKRDGLVDLFQIGGHGPALLPGYIAQAVADHVDDAQLDLGLREGGFDGLGKAAEAIDTGDEEIFDAAVFQLIEHAQPEFGAFTLGDSQSQKLFLAVEVDCQRQIHRLVGHRAVGANLDL